MFHQPTFLLFAFKNWPHCISTRWIIRILSIHRIRHSSDCSMYVVCVYVAHTQCLCSDDARRRLCLAHWHTKYSHPNSVDRTITSCANLPNVCAHIFVCDLILLPLITAIVCTHSHTHLDHARHWRSADAHADDRHHTNRVPCTALWPFR